MPEIPEHHAHAGEREQAAQPAHHVEGFDGQQAFDKGMGQGAVGQGFTPHQPFNDTRRPHAADIEEGAGDVQPEMKLHGRP